MVKSKTNTKVSKFGIWNFKNRKLFRISEFISHNKTEFWLLIIILLIGGFFRLYKIGEYMTFLGDEGRDAIVVRRLLVDFDPILVGPGTSIGNMYLGPLYYYLMAPFLLLFNFSPVGPSIMVSLFGIMTIFFVWLVVREWFPRKIKGHFLQVVNWGAVSAAALYAVSPVVIKLSRSSWNPNIMPFFSLLAIYSVWKIYGKPTLKWFLVLSVSLAFVLNSHYLGLLLFPVVVLFLLLKYLMITKLGRAEKWKMEIGKYNKNIFIAFIVFLILMSPLFIFDARHDWRNLEALKTFFTVRQETVSIKPWKAIPNIGQIGNDVVSRLMAGTNELAGKFMSAIFILGALAYIFRLAKVKNIKNKKDFDYLILFTWLGVALIGLGLYKQHIYDHYYGFFFTAPFILLGGFVNTLMPKKSFTSLFSFLVLFLYLLFVNLQNSPLKDPPNRQMQRAEEVAQLIGQMSNTQKFNLAVIAENNYEDGYQYFLEKMDLPVYDIDPLDYDKTLTKQLFVVCEMSKEKCDPVNNPKAGIANFGWSKIESEWNVSGVVVYKLVHTN